MAKWTLHPDEWYPVLQVNRYGAGNSYDTREAEFTDDEICDMVELEVKFNSMQRKIAERFGLPCSEFTLVYEDEGASISRTSTRNAGRSE